MTRRIALRTTGKGFSFKRAMYRNLVTDLLGYEKIITTEAKGKQISGLAEKMITLGKAGDLHARRQALSFLFDKTVADKVFSELAQRYAQTNGGYTRITKLGRRRGDGAPTVQVELVKQES
ncbi:MAG: RplQ [Dehalococcoidales bacterium]|nr:RplQ [Dehalococcoidales bacterium]